MTKVTSPSQFNSDHRIAYFTGKKSYDDAIKEANEWAERNKVELISYFEQSAFGKSILVSYRRIEQ